MPLNLYYNIQDSNGDVSTTTVPIPTGTALTLLPAAVLAFGNLIKDLTLGGLVSAGVQIEVDISGSWGPAAMLIADVQEKAEFAFRAVNGFLRRMNIPCFDEDLFVAGEEVVDVGDAAVAAFLTAMEDGLTVSGTLIQPVDIHNNDLDSFEYGTENWGRRRRRR